MCYTRKGNILGAGAQPSSLPAAVDEAFKAQASAHAQGADAFGAVHLVASDGKQFRSPGADVDGDLSRDLRGVGV